MSSVDFLKNNDNIKEGINENFLNLILKSYNPHLLCIYGKPRMGKSTLLNHLLSRFQENNEEENDSNYFLLDEPFKVGHGEGNFTTKGCNIFGKIKLSELLKRNCCNNFNHMKDADLFIVDTEGLNSLGGNTSACISGILTLLQVSTIKIYYIGDIETKDVVNAEQLIKLSDVVNYKSQNYSSQKIFLLKKNASIDRKNKKKNDILIALNQSRNQIQNLIYQNLENKNISNIIQYFCLPNFDRASDNKEYELAYKECMKNLVIEIGKSVQNKITYSNDLITKINFFISFFGQINNITQLNNLGEVFEEIFEQKAEEYFKEIKNVICNLINNLDAQIIQYKGSLQDIQSFINSFINKNKKIEMEILMNSIPKKIGNLKKNLSLEIYNKLMVKISDYIKSQNIEITNSIKNHNVNALISFIENSNYQEEITQEKMNHYYNKFKSKIENKHNKFLNYFLNNNELNSFYQKLNNDYFAYAINLKSKKPIWKETLDNYFELISSTIDDMINEISTFSKEKSEQIKNNNYKNYYDEFESLKNMYEFNVFNKDDYYKKIEEKIKIIKNEINKKINPDLQYFPPTPYKDYSIVDGLKAIGADSSYDYREKIAEKNGIESYLGTPQQNTVMLNLLKEGKLLKP